MIEEILIESPVPIALFMIFYAMLRLERKVERVIDILHKVNGGGKR